MAQHRSIRKKVSIIGKAGRKKAKLRLSHNKQTNRVHQKEDENPLLAIQKIHLLKKQYQFAQGQTQVFQTRLKQLQHKMEDIREEIAREEKIAQKLLQEIGLKDINNTPFQPKKNKGHKKRSEPEVESDDSPDVPSGLVEIGY
jgi:hypothetical protein